MKNNKSFSPNTTGASSLLAIFGVLCLGVLALVTLSTAKAHSRLAEQGTEAVERYYAADLEAEKIFAGLRRGQMSHGVEQDGNIYRYSCRISQNRILAVELEADNGVWTIIRWQEQAVTDPIDDSLAVWQGE